MPPLSERSKALIFTSAPLVLLFTYWVVVDLAFGWSVIPQVVPIMLSWGVFFGLPVALAVSSDLAFAPLAVYALLCCLMPAAPSSPVKTFRQLHQDITPGLLVPAVWEARLQRFPRDGRWSPPRIERYGEGDIVLRLDPDDARYNAEIIRIEVRNGRVVSSDYSAD